MDSDIRASLYACPLCASVHVCSYVCSYVCVLTCVSLHVCPYMCALTQDPKEQEQLIELMDEGRKALLHNLLELQVPTYKRFCI